MKLTNLLAGVATATVLLFIGGTALAATITYDVTITGSGDYSNNGVNTPFSDLTVKVALYGDTTSLFVVPGVAQYVHLTRGSVTYSGITRALTGNSGAAFASFPGFDVVGNGEFASGPHSGAFTLFNALFSPALAGYNDISNIGPISVLAVDTSLGHPWQYETGTGIPNDYIDFYNVSNATFSATVPEPATWAMMLVGFGGLGGMIRTRRRQVAATA